MSNQFQPLADGEVVSIEGTYRVSELTAQIRSKVANALSEWSTEQGIDGEALRFGSTSWQKGKVRLHLSIEFAPDDATTQAVVSNVQANTTPPAAPAPVIPASPETHKTAQMAMASPVQEVVADNTLELESPSITSLATPVAVGAVAAAAAAATTVAPEIASTLDDENFDLGTMSDVTGEIEMHLNDGVAEEHSGYVDFDLSAAMLEINLDELVSQVDVSRTALIDEVWNEMSQPNWPGVSRT